MNLLRPAPLYFSVFKNGEKTKRVFIRALISHKQELRTLSHSGDAKTTDLMPGDRMRASPQCDRDRD